jgi:dihydroorotase
VIDPDAEWTVGEEPFQSKSVNSAFLGRTLTGRVEMTVAGGRLAWRRGS